VVDPQQMIPAPVREYLVDFIAEQKGVTNPIDIFFAWLGFGEGVVSWRTEPGTGLRGTSRIQITGEQADELRAIETGKEPQTRVQGWRDDDGRAL
jgi:hypothetical protein